MLRIDDVGTVTVTVHRSEMGQGVRTSLPMILAEELEADWSTLRVEQAPGDFKYGDQHTGSSLSIVRTYDRLRRLGATAREMLIAAAAQRWGVAPRTCRAENGAVIHLPTGRRLTYGELVKTAATLPVPGDIPLKEPQDFRIIGTRKGQIDEPQIVTGRAIYGLDVRAPGMLYAVIARCPVLGGKVESFDASRAQAIPGVRRILQVDSGVAVVAENTWAAIQGRQALQVQWDLGPNADLNSAQIRQQLEKLIAVVSAQASAARAVEAVYELPYLAHATMEPMNCTADVRAGHCEVWAPTQAPQEARTAVTAIGLPHSAVRVNVLLMGGGFGRRSATDYATEAAQVSQAIGAPVQVVWTREDDIQHDLYRPTSLHRLRAELDARGLPVSWQHDVAGLGGVYTLGASDLTYHIPARVTLKPSPVNVPTGPWTSVCNSLMAFANESFLDEIAAASGQAPYELRRELLAERPRAVLELAAQKAGWGTALPHGWGRGIAFHTTWKMTHVAQVAEVSVDSNGTIQVHRVVCAVDCGRPINPDMIEAQMEMGITLGLTAALNGEITLENGRVQQSNFADYPLLRMNEAPAIEVHIVPSAEPPQGIGEMGVPPIAPAVANAVFAATGKRLRRLPIRSSL